VLCGLEFHVGEPFAVKCGVRQGGVLSPYLFAIYMDASIDSLRYSGYSAFIGNTFIGCILCADDIVLISRTCNGLQSLVDTCYRYGSDWDIRFNPQKCQVSTFGSHCPQFCVTINNQPISWSISVRYLGCNVISRTCMIDPRQGIGKFYGMVNNILSVLGCNKIEPMAVHWVKSYCLPSLLYSCEVWSVTDIDMQSLKVAWNNTFRKILSACWRESVNSLLFDCKGMPLDYILDIHKLVFFKRSVRRNNEITALICNLAQNDIKLLGYQYNVVLKRDSIYKN
jgi:hypothetical protein